VLKKKDGSNNQRDYLFMAQVLQARKVRSLDAKNPHARVIKTTLGETRETSLGHTKESLYLLKQSTTMEDYLLIKVL